MGKCSVDVSFIMDFLDYDSQFFDKEITRKDCLLLIEQCERRDESIIPNDKLLDFLSSYNMKLEDWDSLTLEEKNLVFYARQDGIFMGEEKEGKLYANLDEPLTYYQAIVFFMRWYNLNCIVLNRDNATWGNMHKNWLDYAEDIGILYGRIPNFVYQYAYCTMNVPEAEKAYIEQRKDMPISKDDFQCFFYNTITAPTYSDGYKRLSQNSIINMLFQRRNEVSNLNISQETAIKISEAFLEGEIEQEIDFAERNIKELEDKYLIYQQEYTMLISKFDGRITYFTSNMELEE